MLLDQEIFLSTRDYFVQCEQRDKFGHCEDDNEIFNFPVIYKLNLNLHLLWEKIPRSRMEYQVYFILEVYELQRNYKIKLFGR